MYSELVGDAEQDVGSFNAQIVKRDRGLFEKKKAMGPLRYDYHEREMIFKRRLLSNIENFEQGIIDKCESQTPPEKLEAFFYSSIEQYQMMPQSNMHFYRDNIYYQLKYQENDVNIGFSKDPHHADLYTEITDISVADKKSLLAQFNQHYYKNRTGMNKNSPDIENLSDDFGAQHIVLYRFQPKPRYKELEKYQALINRPLLTLFKEELALSYNWMMDDIKLITQDYYTYATWLIADPTKAKLSKFGPQLSVYNDVPFWLTEVSADCSNAHIGYLMDMVTIFQPEYLGSVKLDYQFSLWDNLLRDENTLYTHLLKGGQPEGGNLWDKLIALREDPANEKKSTDELIDAMYQAIEQQALQPATGDTAVTAPNAKSPTQLDTVNDH